MKKLSSLFLTLVVILLSANVSKATHAAGGELIYELVPGTTNTYNFIFKFYRACGTAGVASSTEPASFTMCYTNTCNNIINQIILPKIVGNIPTTPSVPNGSVLSNGCDSTITTCQNLNSAIPGYEQWWYSATLTLPSTCNIWSFYVVLCCRNTTIQNITTPPGSQNIYVEASFDNTVSQANSSPVFVNSNSSASLPLPYICVNSPYYHIGGATDPDGDSLFFEMITPKTKTGCAAGAATNLLLPAYNILNTGGNPLPCNNTFTMDQNTGDFSFTPNLQGVYVISIKCSEYRNGTFIGAVMRDMQVVVDNCVPLPVVSVLDSLNVTNGVAQNDTVKSCPDNLLSFCFDIEDTTFGNIVVFLFDNSSVVMPGSSVVYTKPYDSVLHCCVTWQTTIADTGIHILYVSVKDSVHCLTNPALVAVPIFIYRPIKASADTSICLTDSTFLSSYGNETYQWSIVPGGDPNAISCPTCQNTWVSPNVTTTFIVTDLQCNTTDSVTVQVVPGSLLTITPDTTTCSYATLQLNVSASPAGAYNYSWSPASYLTSTSISNPVVVNPANPITYTVTVNSAVGTACPSIATVHVDVLNGYDIANNDTSICKGDNVQINVNGGSPKYTYVWTPPGDISNPNIKNPIITPIATGASTYTLNVSFPGCPDSTQSIKISVDPIPVVDAGFDREICSGDTVHLYGSATPGGIVYTYDWQPFADLNDNTIQDPIFDGTSTTNMILEVTSPNGCKGQDNMLIQIVPTQFLTVDGDKSLCPNDTAYLHALGATLYHWTPPLFISDTTGKDVFVYPLTTTVYTIYGVDSKGCNDTAKATIVVNPAAVIDAGDSKTIYPGEQVQLWAEGNCSLNFNWFPPNGLTDTKIKNPWSSPSVTTKYTVNAETEFGCKSSDSVIVNVSPESLIEIPNAFSPGSGTSINDELHIIVRGIAKLNSFKIFNRWGQEVFSTTDIQKGWNGQWNGKSQPLGVYVYVFDAVTSTGKRFVKQGNVTLVR